MFCKKWWKLNIFPHLIDFLPFLLQVLSLYVYAILLKEFRYSMVLGKLNTKVYRKLLSGPCIYIYMYVFSGFWFISKTYDTVNALTSFLLHRSSPQLYWCHSSPPTAGPKTGLSDAKPPPAANHLTNQLTPTPTATKWPLSSSAYIFPSNHSVYEFDKNPYPQIYFDMSPETNFKTKTHHDRSWKKCIHLIF